MTCLKDAIEGITELFVPWCGVYVCKYAYIHTYIL